MLVVEVAAVAQLTVSQAVLADQAVAVLEALGELKELALQQIQAVAVEDAADTIHQSRLLMVETGDQVLLLFVMLAPSVALAEP
jgi:hypothetical protein